MKFHLPSFLSRITPRQLAIGLAIVLLLAAIALGTAGALLYRQLPELSLLTDYRPKQPLRVFTRDGVEIGSFGTERRYHLPIAQTPKLLQDAVLAVEDARFREHGGVDPRGVLRAVFTNLWRGSRSQGGSTITQQVARNFYLSARKSYLRKIREMLLAVKMEQQLSKDQILELYLNQIYLGQRAYGFEAASQVYFGKPLAQLSVAETAMLAGLPQNPNHANPVVNFDKAHARQEVVLSRMLSTGVIDDATFKAAQAEPLHIRRNTEVALHGEYVAEMARQTVFAQYGEQAYTLGLKVYTSLDAAQQRAAVNALRHGVLDYEQRQPYRGPEGDETLPDGTAAPDDATVAHLLADYNDDDDLRLALVLQASPRELSAVLANGETIKVTGLGLKLAQAALSTHASDDIRLHRGSVIRLRHDGVRWAVSQWPESEAALVALDPRSGQVRALAGGFDFAHNQFNHVTQAWRQPGSSFKPFIYSAALEHGVMPGTRVNDAPLPEGAASDVPGWDPQNSDGRFDGPITLREALARSKNLVSIRLVQLLGTDAARQWANRFGFAIEKQPDNLTLALGAGSTTPMQLAGAYAVIANGGYRVKPLLIERIADAQDKTLFQADAPMPQESDRAIPARNAFLTASLLQEVTRSGTAARAQAQLKRPDLYGKTGTTNDAVDAWFAGFQPGLVSVVWMGYDTPRSLGEGESGGGLSLPIWIAFMREALKNQPVQEIAAPEGVVRGAAEGDTDWRYTDAPAMPAPAASAPANP